MKKSSFPIFLFILFYSSVSFSQSPDERQLWIISAKLSRNTTYQRDTVNSFDAGGMTWTKEFHQSAKTTVSGTITAIVENQAENPAKDFLYHSDSGDPVSLTVTGNGSNSQSSNSRETIDGILISADIRTDNVSGSARPGASIYFEYSDENKTFGVSMGVKGVGSYHGRMYSGGRGYGEWKDYGSDIDDYSLHCDGGGDPSTDKNCKMTKTGKGYQGSWKQSESETHHTFNGPEYTTSETTVEITVEPYRESDKPQITLDGCSEFGGGETGNVMASGIPDGGTFEFWVEPSDLMSVDASGTTASLTGKRPGRGTLFVEYTTTDGKKAQTSRPASMVRIYDYNSGTDIPPIALYDVDGKRLSGKLTIPYGSEPDEAQELVDFVSGDPSVFTVAATADNIDLQGLKPGKTTLEAHDNCGNTTGPTVMVEVVNCDEETIATLERMMQAAKEGQKGAYEAIEKIVGTKEFEELENKIAESTGNLAVKTAGLIIGTLAGGTTAGAGVETAAGIYGKASNVMDILKGGDALSQVSNLSQLIVELAGKPIQQAIAGSIETLQAANEFGQDLGKMIGANRELQSAMKDAEHWNKVIIDIVNRQNLCRNSQSAPQNNQQPAANTEPPATNPEPTPAEPTAQTQQPPVQEPNQPGENPPAEPPVTGSDSDERTEISPPSPTSEPRQVGLPYSPAECGCNSSKNLEVSQVGLTSLQSGMENLGDCVEKFSKGPLTNYVQTLEDWKTVLNTLQEATKSKPAEFLQVSEKSIPKMEELMKQTKSFDTEGKTFVDAFGSCPKSINSGFEIMQSVEKITVDSIKTNY